MHKPTLVPHITGILLAAGRSLRMKRPKQLIFYKNKPLITCTLNNLLKSSLGEIVLVLGYKYKDILKKLKLKDKRVTTVVNYEYKKGISASIKKGIKSISHKTSAVFIFLADQPFIGPKIIDKIIRLYLKHPSGELIIAPFYGEKRGHPVLFGKAYFKELAQLKGDTGARSILKKYSKKILKVKFSEPGILQDIDSPEDLDRYKGTVAEYPFCHCERP